MSSYEKRKASFRASKTKYGGLKRAASQSSRRSVGEIKKIARSVGETKVLTDNAPLDVFDTPNLTSLNNLSSGTGINNRVGNKICMQSLEVRGAIAATASTAEATAGFIMVVLDKESNGVVPTLDDIFDLSAGAGGDPAFAMRNPDHTDRFKILYREDMVVGWSYGGTTQNGSGMPSTVQFHKYIDMTKLKDDDRIVRYNGAAAGFSTVVSGGLTFWFVPSNQSAFAAVLNYHATYMQWKLSYKDA